MADWGDATPLAADHEDKPGSTPGDYTILAADVNGLADRVNGITAVLPDEPTSGEDGLPWIYDDASGAMVWAPSGLIYEVALVDGGITRLAVGDALGNGYGGDPATHRLVVRNDGLAGLDEGVAAIFAEGRRNFLELYTTDDSYDGIYPWLYFHAEFHPGLDMGQDFLQFWYGMHTDPAKTARAGLYFGREGSDPNIGFDVESPALGDPQSMRIRDYGTGDVFLNATQGGTVELPQGLKLPVGTPGAGKVWTSDPDGVGSWEDANTDELDDHIADTTSVHGIADTSALATASDIAGRQPLDSDLTAIAALTTTSYGRGLLELANAAAGRTSLDVYDKATIDAISTVVGTKASAASVDALLAQKRMVSFTSMQITAGQAAPTTTFAATVNGGVANTATTGAIQGAFPIFAAELPTIAGKTPKVQVRMVLETNGTDPTIDFTAGLALIGTPGGGANAITTAWGEHVAGSTVVRSTTPSASKFDDLGPALAIPADGHYVPTVEMSGAMPATNPKVQIWLFAYVFHS